MKRAGKPPNRVTSLLPAEANDRVPDNPNEYRCTVIPANPPDAEERIVKAIQYLIQIARGKREAA
jgi:hypothetical protein